MASATFLNQTMVEHRAAALLRRFASLTGTSITLPVPIERIAEDVCDLGILWEPIAEGGQGTILAELRPAERVVAFNECRLPLFETTPFLYNTVLAHEVGHWYLHVDHALANQQAFPGLAVADPPVTSMIPIRGRSVRRSGLPAIYYSHVTSLLIC